MTATPTTARGPARDNVSGGTGPGRPRARRAVLGGWPAELFLGLRLAVAGGRSGWLRLTLTVTGISVGVAVLLLAASVDPALHASQHRSRAASYAVGLRPVPGTDPLRIWPADDSYHGHGIEVRYVQADGPHAPVPPGLSRLPHTNELAVSPALRRLMSGSDGALLRARYPQRVIATIGPAGLAGPRDLIAYVGTTGLPGGDVTYQFGVDVQRPAEPMPPLLWALLVIGVVVLLFPVFVFVMISARMSGAERDRTLAAVRLVGASTAETRRIAAGESLAGALLGLAIGTAGFLLARPLAESQTISGVNPFAGDLVPSAPLVAAIAIGIPALAVGATIVGLRQTLIEPLGVTRRATTVRRRLWWRPLPSLAGAAILLYLTQTNLVRGGDRPTALLVAGVILVLLGIPALLPGVLDRVLGRTWDGTVALQLATRRLRMDSGAPARVVAGLGVVLAGAISLSTVLSVADRQYHDPTPITAPTARVEVDQDSVGSLGALTTAIRRLPGVSSVQPLRELTITTGDQSFDVLAGSCPELGVIAAIPSSCVDGQVFGMDSQVHGGQQVRFESVDGATNSASPAWTVPANVIPVAGRAEEFFQPSLLVTTGALPNLATLPARGYLNARYDPADPDAVERIRTAAAAALQWHARVATSYVTRTVDQSRYGSIRNGLLAGTLLTLLLATATMLVSAIEQIRERRRPLAALAATGVPRSLLARSLLWQNAIPLLLAVVVADVTGVVLATLLLPAVGEHVAIDWSSVTVFTGAGVLAAAAATALTLPSVRWATRPAGLRAE